MPREPFSTNSTLRTATESATGFLVHLLRINYWDGAVQQELLLTDAPVDLSVDVGSGAETWFGSGILISVADIADSGDMDESGVDIAFDGVDQSVISIILSNQYRGQPIEIYKAWFDKDTGLVLGEAALVFKGYQSTQYTISETSTDDPDAVMVSTRATNRLSVLRNENLVLTDPQSLTNYVERCGISTSGENFWSYVPEIVGITQFWGQVDPAVLRAYLDERKRTHYGLKS